jgi:hypothetical protein
MGIALGNSTPSTFKLGNAQVTVIYLGTQSVWTSVPPVITITTQPTTQTTQQTTGGATATFTVSASVTESATLSYQWQRNAQGSSSWVDISGATSATLSLSGLRLGSNQYDRYRCIVSATGGATSVTSSDAELLLFAAGAFFFEPNAAWIGIGFDGSGTPAYPYFYAGQYSGPSTLATIRVTSAGSVRIYSIGSSESLPGYIYLSKNGTVVNQVGSLASSASIESVEYMMSVSPGDTIGIVNTGLRVGNLKVYGGASVSSVTITSHPSPQTASGGAATFSVSATSSSGETLYYQWQRQALGAGAYLGISGATSATLSLTGLTNASNNGDNYRCVVFSATASSVTSNVAALTVGAAASAITITSQPSAQTASSGAATFAVSATNSASEALSYQWQRQALGTGSYAAISGATSATLSLTGLTIAANNGDNYRCVVSSATASSVTSNAALLTVPSAGALLAISRDNGVATSFSGSGTSASPYSRAAGFYDDEANGVSHYKWTASASATVTVSYYFSDDDGGDDAARIRKNGSIVYYTDHDTTVTRTISVVAGDEISIRGVMDGSQYFANVSVYAT